MGWETEALITVRFNRETFDTEESVREYIDERKEEIKNAEDTLRNLAFMTEPKKWCDNDMDPVAYIRQEVDYALETLQRAAIELSDASAVLRGWKHMHAENGGAIRADRDPDSYGYFDALQRINGDFICVVNEDGSNAYPDDEMNTTMWEQLEERHQRYLQYQAERAEREERRKKAEEHEKNNEV